MHMQVFSLLEQNNQMACYEQKNSTLFSLCRNMAYPPSTFNPLKENNVDSFSYFDDEYDPEYKVNTPLYF